MQCWQKDPQHRPSFKTIKEFFASISDAGALEASGGDPNALRGKVAPNEQEERENFRAKLGIDSIFFARFRAPRDVSIARYRSKYKKTTLRGIFFCTFRGGAKKKLFPSPFSFLYLDLS